jgi:hypothetical protein
MTDFKDPEQRRQYHRDYYAKNKPELQRKRLKKAYEQYMAFMAPTEGEKDAKADSIADE